MKTIGLDQAVALLLVKVSHIEQRLTAISENQISAPATRLLLTVKQASGILNLSVPAVYRMIRRGEITYLERSHRIYFLQADLVSYLKSARSGWKNERMAHVASGQSNVNSRRLPK